jgi:diadenosine tetraphosphate (Ap4A) HIT family hydrolase
MGEIVAERVCPLCPPLKWHTKPILEDDGKWFITENSHPYEAAQHHLLIIPKRHIELLSELETEDLESILALSNWATREFDIRGGGLTMRFGETLFTGATVKHLHAHLIVPKVDGDRVVSPVYFPIG